MTSRLCVLGFFLIGLTLTVALVPRRSRNAIETENRVDIRAIPGISEGEIAVLPTMQDLALEPVRLNSGEGAYRFFVIFASSCDACEKDVGFWKLLAEEAARRRIPFYLVAMDSESEPVRLFLDRFGLRHLRTVFDRQGEASRNLKINVVPQYLLVTKDGRVVARWTGVSHFNSKQEKIGNPAQMFEAISE